MSARYDDDFLLEEYTLSSDEISDLEELSRDVIVGYSDWTADTIVAQIKKGNIVLDPNFQRRDAWENVRKSTFIESLILGLPIPQIVLAEGSRKGSFIVIDGRQRLLTLMQFFADSQSEFQPLKLSGLKTLTKCNKKTSEDLKRDMLLGDYYMNVENSTIRTVVIKNWKSESILYQIFLRLNTSSVPLSPQELRGALHPGDFINYANNYSSSNKNLQKILKNEGRPDFRMRDVEIYLRYISFYFFINQYQGNLKKFLDDTCINLNNKWVNMQLQVEEASTCFDLACETTFSLFGKDAFHKWDGKKFESRFNRSVFDIMVYYFSTPEIAREALKNKDKIVSKFKELCTDDAEFIAALERTTKSVVSTRNRLSIWGEELKKILTTCKIDIPKIG